MTNEEARALYGRAVAAGFRLEPGCRAWFMGEIDTVVWVGERPNRSWLGHHVETHRFDMKPVAQVWCDFREAPSLGCLLKQVRAAWCDPAACTMSHTVSGVVEWLIWMPGHDRAATPDESRPTESDALVAALEAAPKVRP